MKSLQTDPFRSRGAVEQNTPEQEGNLDFRGQIGHRNKGPLIDSSDTDFPEPGENPEHSGEVIMQEEKRSPMLQDEELDADDVRDQVDQDPGQRQKENQNDSEEDPLAA